MQQKNFSRQKSGPLSRWAESMIPYAAAVPRMHMRSTRSQSIPRGYGTTSKHEAFLTSMLRLYSRRIIRPWPIHPCCSTAIIRIQNHDGGTEGLGLQAITLRRPHRCGRESLTHGSTISPGPSVPVYAMTNPIFVDLSPLD